MTSTKCFACILQTAMTMGNASAAAFAGQQSSNPIPIPLPSHPISVPSTTMPTLQIPSPSLPASSPLMALLDVPDARSDNNQATNLVKPSSFFVPPLSSSAQMMSSVSSSIPTAPPLNPPMTLQRPYGAPLLQPFPPPSPPPSLTPTSVFSLNHGPAISKDKVREALLALVQVSFSSMVMAQWMKLKFEF